MPWSSHGRHGLGIPRSGDARDTVEAVPIELRAGPGKESLMASSGLHWALVVALVVSAAGCRAAARCTSGARQSCYCSPTRMGAQACNGLGAYGPCDCSPPRDGGMPDVPPPEMCWTDSMSGAQCCAPPEVFAAIPQECPPTFDVACSDGTQCISHSTCSGGRCFCEPPYLAYHCDGTSRPCTGTDPCTEMAFCARCPAGARVAQYVAIDAPLASVSEGCVAPLVLCGSIHCYDPSVHVCCADVSSERDLCFVGDRCTPSGYCNDNGMAPP